MTKLKQVIQGVVLLAAIFSLSVVSDADELIDSQLNDNLATHFNQQTAAKFIAVESIEQYHADEFGKMRYLVLDFDLALASTNIQTSIHSICSSVLNDLGLVKKLSDQGYDMISVSFDRDSQYDCL